MDVPLFPIGRFSEATRLSVKALRHYDEIGLLEPAVVDPETGYRFYRAGQANHAEVIRVLRDLDMPLDQISEVLAAVAEPELMKKTLDAHRQRLAEELERHGRMITYLERLLTDEETLMPYEIALETVPDRTIASVRFSTTMETMPEQLGGAFGQVFAALGAAGTAPVGPPLVVFHDVIDTEAPGEIEVAIPCDGSFRGKGAVRASRLDGGRAAVTIHRGPYREVAPAYHAVTNWIAEQDQDSAGPPREIYLNDPGEVAEDELLTRIEWPVR